MLNTVIGLDLGTTTLGIAYSDSFGFVHGIDLSIKLFRVSLRRFIRRVCCLLSPILCQKSTAKLSKSQFLAKFFCKPRFLSIETH